MFIVKVTYNFKNIKKIKLSLLLQVKRVLVLMAHAWRKKNVNIMENK